MFRGHRVFGESVGAERPLTGQTFTNAMILCDVNMPNMDGLTMAEKVRSELNNVSISIIMLTTENSPAMKERGNAAGIKGWIVKPFKGDVVIATFKKLVGA